MDALDLFFKKYSYKFDKGYPDMNNKQDVLLLESLLGFSLEEGTKEKNAIKKIVDANPGKFDTMSNDFRIANLAKVSPDEFTDAIKNTYGADTEVKITPPKTENNKSSKFNMFTFNDDGNVINIYLAGGASANQGIAYENQIAQDLQTYNEGGTEFTHKNTVEKIIDTFKLKPGEFTIKEEGKENKKRPLEFTSSGPIIGYSGKSVAATLTDLTIIQNTSEGETKKTHYISLKYGSTLTFFNAGVTSVLPASEIQKGKITNANGIALLETLNIDNELFCKVFNEYSETNFKQYHSIASDDFDSTKLFNLIQSGIGSGYWMLKGSSKGSDFYEITESYSKTASTPTGKPKVLYGGVDGKGKRVDITFESKDYFFKVNIRNKQGGLYPSHIMCDYIKK